ncbi:MAG: hypothetical protein HZA70_00250 [Planctomycetes bacterium]|nr:hypothetical protein [Planctomycetota bacterium]
MPELEKRQGKIEGILEQLVRRVDKLEVEVGEIRKELHTNFRWLVGIIIVTWVTTIVTILTKV